MADGDSVDGESVLDFDFHYDDYVYDNEESAEDRAAERSYREKHSEGEEEA